MALPRTLKSCTLAVGAQLKSTFAIGRGDQAILSHHLGDLDHFENSLAFQRDIGLYEELFSLRPEKIVCDLHPDYASTHYAMKRGLPLLKVQHHHAHMAACMAEHHLTRPVIGICLDGTGLGLDGAIWGGEFFSGDYAAFQRHFHLRYVPLPGGDSGVREPWRMALSHLMDSGCSLEALSKEIDPAALRIVQQMIHKRISSPLTSSAGRLFDAVAALAGIRQQVNFEAQAAMELQYSAQTISTAGLNPYPFDFDQDSIDTRRMIQAIVAGKEPAPMIAARFHLTLADMILSAAQKIRRQTGLNSVVLAGGVFLNPLLHALAAKNLARSGFEVYVHQQTPPNDASISIGQLAIVAGTR
jgi:hydrogenase maturation protein HypF